MVKFFFKLDNIMLLKFDFEKYVGVWIVYLKLIVDYFKLGEGVWWREIEDYIEFFDGLDEFSFRLEGL